MVHPVVTCTVEQAAGSCHCWQEEAVRQACEATKGQGYEVAYEVYKKAYARSLEAFYQKARALGHRWPRG